MPDALANVGCTCRLFHWTYWNCSIKLFALCWTICALLQNYSYNRCLRLTLANVDCKCRLFHWSYWNCRTKPFALCWTICALLQNYSCFIETSLKLHWRFIETLLKLCWNFVELFAPYWTVRALLQNYLCFLKTVLGCWSRCWLSDTSGVAVSLFVREVRETSSVRVTIS